MKKLMVLALAALMLFGFAGAVRAADIKPYNLSAEYAILPGKINPEESNLVVYIYFENNKDETVPFGHKVRFMATGGADKFFSDERGGITGRVVPPISKTFVRRLAYPIYKNYRTDSSLPFVFGRECTISFDIINDPADGKGALASVTQVIRIPKQDRAKGKVLVWKDGQWVDSY